MKIRLCAIARLIFPDKDNPESDNCTWREITYILISMGLLLLLGWYLS